MKKATIRKYGMMMDMRMIAPMICDDVDASILKESENAEFILIRNDSRKDFDAQVLTANQIIHSVNIFQLVSEMKIQVVETFSNLPLVKRFIMRPKGVVSKKLIGAYMTR